VRDLYGLNSAGAAFRNHIAECMKHLVWKPCRADHDLWIKAETHPEDGVMYWAYIMICVDNILCVWHNLLVGYETGEDCSVKWSCCLGHESKQVCVF
jgi:hypothetical protein